ncbi:MAG: phosphoribosylanthranilate isomerase [PVC group bacterium]|nr:phosphoribosylanthranilate isomerase [PVC group bacterium]
MTKIKICGITRLKDALSAAEYGADAVGFVFAKSPRRISPVAASRIIDNLPPFIAKVGLFVNAEKEEVLNILKTCQLDTLQFHGEESDKYCNFFRKYCKIIKAFRIKDNSSLKQACSYKYIDACLCDTYDPKKHGGTGKSFNWNILKNSGLKKPVIIAGGASLSNVGKIIHKLKPYGIDVSSSIERSPGKKDARIMRKFIKTVTKESL